MGRRGVGQNNPFKVMAAGAVAIIGLVAITLTGMAVTTGFMNTGMVDNDTANAFLVGLGLFGAFSTILVIGIVGKIIVNMYKTNY